MWTVVIGGAAACYLLKVAGLAVPQSRLEGERVQRIAALLPVALLAALIAIGAFSTGRSLAIDAGAAGLAIAVVAVVLRAPFLVVVALAAISTAAIRLL